MSAKMSSKRSKKGKSKAVTQNDLRKIMTDMKNKRTNTSSSQYGAASSYVTNNNKKETRTLITDPEVYKKALNDRMKVKMLEESNKEPAKSLKRPLPTNGQKSVSNLSVATEKPPDPKAAKVEKKQKKREKIKSKTTEKSNVKQNQEKPAIVEARAAEEKVVEKEPEKMETEPSTKSSNSVLPEGFFDDPEIDAKFRGVETPADVMDKQWEEFQKEIQRETGQSAQIVEEQQEIGNVDRQIEEIDEQIHLFSRVEKLNIVRDEIKQKIKKKKMQVSDSDHEDAESDEVDENSLDWREKDAFF